MVGRCADSARHKITAYAAEYAGKIESPALDKMQGFTACEFDNPTEREFYHLCVAAYINCMPSQRETVKQHFLMVLERMKAQND